MYFPHLSIGQLPVDEEEVGEFLACAFRPMAQSFVSRERRIYK